MNALEEINGMVKKAWGLNLGSLFGSTPITNPTLKRMAAKPIDYYRPDWQKQIKSWKDDESKNRAKYAKQEADWKKNVLSSYAKATGSSVAQANSAFNRYRSGSLGTGNAVAMVNNGQRPNIMGGTTPGTVSPAKPSANADPKIMPNGLRIKGSGWTGRQVVQAGSAPVSRIQRSELNPFRSLKNPSQLAQLPSMQMMRKMNDPNWNTSDRIRRVAKSYLPRQYLLAAKQDATSANPDQISQQAALNRTTRRYGNGSGIRMRSLPTGSLGGWSRKL